MKNKCDMRATRIDIYTTYNINSTRGAAISILTIRSWGKTLTGFIHFCYQLSDFISLTYLTCWQVHIALPYVTIGLSRMLFLKYMDLYKPLASNTKFSITLILFRVYISFKARTIFIKMFTLRHIYSGT